MDFELTDEQRLIKQTAREFTDNEIVERSRENARNHHFDLEIVQKLGAQGYLGAIVPAEYEGRPIAPDPAVATAIADDLAAAERKRAEPIGVTLDGAIRARYRDESALGDLAAFLAMQADS